MKYQYTIKRSEGGADQPPNSPRDRRRPRPGSNSGTETYAVIEIESGLQIVDIDPASQSNVPWIAVRPGDLVDPADVLGQAADDAVEVRVFLADD